jgi:chromosome segregation ATPase
LEKYKLQADDLNENLKSTTQSLSKANKDIDDQKKMMAQQSINLLTAVDRRDGELDSKNIKINSINLEIKELKNTKAAQASEIKDLQNSNSVLISQAGAQKIKFEEIANSYATEVENHKVLNSSFEAYRY